jgi:AraC family transcriptional regulator, regulatory protein of adaptative response / methylphosphotriester-DNA alkyltransferase methyltransferase
MPRGPRITYVPTQRPTTIHLRTALYDDACAIVEEEYAADLSLDDIARRIASSRRQLQRAFAEIGDTTFRDHLTQVRMRRAADLLATRGMTVREVANRVGYRQPAQFAKAFRRHIGVSPSAFRVDGRAAQAGVDGRGMGLGTGRFGRPDGVDGRGFAGRQFAA